MTFTQSTLPLNRTAKRQNPLLGEAQAEAWPSISVVIPTFDRRDVVCRAVRALAAMSYAGPVELIVVVDGSTDGTAEALSVIQLPFRTRIIEHEAVYLC